MPRHSSPARVTSVVCSCIPAHCSAEGHHLWAGTVPPLLLLYLCKNLLHTLQMVWLFLAYFCLFLALCTKLERDRQRNLFGFDSRLYFFPFQWDCSLNNFAQKGTCTQKFTAVILLYLLQTFSNINTLKNSNSAFSHICTADLNHQNLRHFIIKNDNTGKLATQ